MIFKEWYDKQDDDFKMSLHGIVGVGLFFLFPIFLIFIFDGISSAYRWSSLQLCYLTKRCVAVEFLGKKYPAKTTPEFDDKISGLLNGAVVFNVESKIIHWDEDCKFARLCTENCIYLPYNIAHLLKENKIAKDCKYEYYTHKNCQSTCGDISSPLGNVCVDVCVYDTYNDEQFDKDRFLEDASKGAYDIEPPNTY